MGAAATAKIQSHAPRPRAYGRTGAEEIMRRRAILQERLPDSGWTYKVPHIELTHLPDKIQGAGLLIGQILYRIWKGCVFPRGKKRPDWVDVDMDLLTAAGRCKERAAEEALASLVTLKLFERRENPEDRRKIQMRPLIENWMTAPDYVLPERKPMEIAEEVHAPEIPQAHTAVVVASGGHSEPVELPSGERLRVVNELPRACGVVVEEHDWNLTVRISEVEPNQQDKNTRTRVRRNSVVAIDSKGVTDSKISQQVDLQQVTPVIELANPHLGGNPDSDQVRRLARALQGRDVPKFCRALANRLETSTKVKKWSLVVDIAYDWAAKNAPTEQPAAEPDRKAELRGLQQQRELWEGILSGPSSSDQERKWARERLPEIRKRLAELG